MPPRRMVHVTLASGHDLNVVNCFTRMEVYAIVKTSGDKENKDKARSPTDSDGGANPTWNFSTQFTVDDSKIHKNDLKLVFKLISERTLGDKEVGKVKVPLLELFHSAAADGSSQSVSYQVKKPSGKPKGTITFSYRFGEKFDVPAPEDGYGFAPPGTSAGDPYYPPAQEYGHGYPQPGGYPPYPGQGYPPPGYGYPPQGPYGHPPQGPYGYAPVEKHKKEKDEKSGFFGAAVGGIVGGLVGGMLVGGGEEEEDHHSCHKSSSSSSSCGSD